MGYFDKLCKEAVKNISQYGDFETFVDADHETFENYIRNSKGGLDDEVVPF